MLKSKPVNLVKQFVCYVFGLFLISIGINFSKMSNLGITPVSSIPRACEQIWGFTLGVTTMIIYILLVVLQLIILRKRFKVTNALGIIVTFIFSWLVDFTGTDPNAFGHLLLNFPRPQNYPMQLVYLLVSLVISALGCFYLLASPVGRLCRRKAFAGAIATGYG